MRERPGRQQGNAPEVAHSLCSRPDQLILHDDPAFLPDLSLPSFDPDLLDLQKAICPPRFLSDTMSLQTVSQHGSQQGPPLGGLQLPSSDSGGMGGFDIPGYHSGSRAPRPSSLLAREEDDGLLPEVDFGIDADGNLIEFGGPERIDDVPGSVRPLVPSDTAARERVRLEHEAGQHVGAGIEVSSRICLL